MDDDEQRWRHLREAQLAGLADELRQHGLTEVPSDVDFVRYIQPEEVAIVHGEYLRQCGYEVKASGDGRSYTVDDREFDSEQAAAYYADVYRCNAMFPVHPVYSRHLDENQLRVVYNYYVSQLVPCLQQRGFDVGPIPSWQEFAETSYPKRWTPYHAVVREVLASRLSPDAYEELKGDCDPNPPSAEVFPQSSQ